MVGWAEYVSLPDWGVKGLRAKTDTGAKSSSLHVENMKLLRDDRVKFEVVVHRHKRDLWVPVVADVIRMGKVRVANGESALRPYVITTLRVGPIEREIEVNLMDRGQMIHRMLLGRTALEGVLVDVTRRYALGTRPEKKPAPRPRRKTLR